MKYNISYVVKGNVYGGTLHIEVIASSKHDAEETAKEQLSGIFRKEHIIILDVEPIKPNTNKIKY